MQFAEQLRSENLKLLASILLTTPQGRILNICSELKQTEEGLTSFDVVNWETLERRRIHFKIEEIYPKPQEGLITEKGKIVEYDPEAKEFIIDIHKEEGEGYTIRASKELAEEGIDVPQSVQIKGLPKYGAMIQITSIESLPGAEKKQKLKLRVDEQYSVYDSIELEEIDVAKVTYVGNTEVDVFASSEAFRAETKEKIRKGTIFKLAPGDQIIIKQGTDIRKSI